MGIKIEQYKILWGQFNGELSRFWNRFNVLLGIQLGSAIAFIKALEGQKEYYWIVFTFLILLSFITIKIVVRAIETYKFNIYAIQRFEKENEKIGMLNKLTDSIKTEKGIKFNIANPIAYRLALIIPSATLILWTGFLISEIEKLMG